MLEFICLFITLNFVKLFEDGVFGDELWDCLFHETHHFWNFDFMGEVFELARYN